jgi:hypothetical protein
VGGLLQCVEPKLPLHRIDPRESVAEIQLLFEPRLVC